MTDTPPPTLTPAMISAGRRELDDNSVEILFETATHRHAWELEGIEVWATTVSLAEFNEHDELGAPVEIAGALAALVRIDPGSDPDRFLDACDEVGGELFAMAEIVHERMADLSRIAPLDIVHLDTVRVEPQVRGHRWGVTAAAVLLDALAVRSPFTLVTAFTAMDDPADAPIHAAVENIRLGCGLQPLGDTGLAVAHSSEPTLRSSINRWLDGQGGRRG